MTNKNFKKAIQLMNSFSEINTWTSKKHEILENVIKIMESGVYEYFTSDYRIHGEFVGSYYLEKNHTRRGTLKKYRGKEIMVLCCKRVGMAPRLYIVATIEE